MNQPDYTDPVKALTAILDHLQKAGFVLTHGPNESGFNADVKYTEQGRKVIQAFKNFDSDFSSLPQNEKELALAYCFDSRVNIPAEIIDRLQEKGWVKNRIKTDQEKWTLILSPRALEIMQTIHDFADAMRPVTVEAMRAYLVLFTEKYTSARN